MLFVCMMSTGVLLLIIVTTTAGNEFFVSVSCEKMFGKCNKLPFYDELFHFWFHYKQEKDDDTLYGVR